jgi:protein-tyrosine phosphatase
MTDFSRKFNYDEIPDPYYGGDEGFELVLDLLEDAGKGLYDYLKSPKQA